MPSLPSSNHEEVSEAADQLAKMAVGAEPDGTVTGSDEHARTSKKDGADDPELFKSHPPREDCPVCLVPLPINQELLTYWHCCGKLICNACDEEHKRAVRLTNMKRKKKEQPLVELTCAFCRTPLHKNDEEQKKRLESRVRQGDCEALIQLAALYADGVCGFQKDEAKALELYHRAADLGFVSAITELARIYLFCDLCVPKDEEKGRQYLIEATKKGNVRARCKLGQLEHDRGNVNLAIRHWRVAAAAGEVDAMKDLWGWFGAGKLSKVELEETLRAHKEAFDEMNSEDRQRFAAYEKAKEGDDETLEKLYGSYYMGYLNAKELKTALKCNRGGHWNHAEIRTVYMAAQARLRASGYL